VWIVHRTPEQVAALPKHDAELADPKSLRHPDELTPPYARNEHRSRKPEYLVVVGICTHLGCSPTDKFQAGPQPSLPDDWPGGFLCPCHGSTFDLAGRVFKNKPAPDNLEVPPHMYLSDTKLLIGEDKGGNA
jgi:ubiquinol-cytochrome c reductase iron-sulfur subunit